MTLRRTIWLASVTAICAVAFVGYFVDRALRVATGLIAHDVCAKAFVSGFDPQTVFAETMMRPEIGRLRSVSRHEVDWSMRTVSASMMGWAGSRAAFHDGLGCIILRGPADPRLPKAEIARLKAVQDQSVIADSGGPSVIEPSNVNLKRALDNAFAEPSAPPYRRTKAVVVLLDGQIVAERYATGVGIDTPLLGFSLTKSVVSAMIGILVRQGRLAPSQAAPIAEWQDEGNPRRLITIEQLLRMTSGLRDDGRLGFDASSQMLYLHQDMAKFAASAAVIAAPGTRWAYSSLNTQLLARIIRDSVGGPEKTLEFAWHELFNPLGMQNVIVEFDGSGTLQGSSYMFASARDWARFGLLYLNDGMIGSRRILPEGWVEFSAQPTLDTGYGAGFWTSRGNRERAENPLSATTPPDAFYGLGNLGQIVVILPSHRLVIVRLGDSVDVTVEMRGLTQLINEIIAGINH
ncbi:MAG: serine hydrolase [Bradyrhizobium sp.]|uniref:serine hydrolase domain-containing protein n=1 Tax=Bradyrhizobium sp. TaxID=376 RepID=UPI0025C27FD3|nr:serine hydrolase [Bradyrhizobium sp.]MBI5265043.1 serine hydrolase [Bradyrhizobium sp.]